MVQILESTFPFSGMNFEEYFGKFEFFCQIVGNFRKINFFHIPGMLLERSLCAFSSLSDYLIIFDVLIYTYRYQSCSRENRP